MTKDDGWHDYGTNPTGPHRPPEPAGKPRRKGSETDVNLRTEQIARLQRIGAAEADAAAIVDAHDPADLVERSDDALELLVDAHRAAGSVDMSTIASALGWVDAAETGDQLDRARIVLELEEARRKPRRGVLDPLREFVAANATTSEPLPSAGPDGGSMIRTATVEEQVSDDAGPAEPVADPAEANSIEVAESSIAKVLEWVADDPKSAQLALKAERSRDEDDIRKTLVEKLEAIVSGSA